MAVKSILSIQEDFTGEIPITENTAAMWRFNESGPDGNSQLADSSGNGRHFTISGFDGTTASLRDSWRGRYFRMNISNPTTEKTHLIAVNDGSFFSDLGDKIVVGGWITPTTYSVGNTYCPIFNTRNGPGQPILYLSLFSGSPRIMIYNASGTLILDQTETPTITLKNNGWYYIAVIINVTNKTAQFVLGDRGDGTLWTAPLPFNKFSFCNGNDRILHEFSVFRCFITFGDNFCLTWQVKNFFCFHKNCTMLTKFSFQTLYILIANYNLHLVTIIVFNPFCFNK